MEVIFRNFYNVIAASNGNDALELIKSNTVDVAILDIRMTGMSGIELLEKLKAADPSIEAMMLTGYETIETIRQALRYGACDYLSKPYDVETIRAAVANAMERRTFVEEIRSTHQKMTSLQIELQQHTIDEEITRNKGEIYASILHDINGPLTIIAGYIQLINVDLDSIRRFEGQQIEELKDHLRLINRQVTHCVDISQRYLSFLRRKPSEKATTSVNKVLEDLGALLKGHPSCAAHELQIESLKSDAIVSINGADAVQILLNLAVNAFQSTATLHRVRIYGEIIQQPLKFSEFKRSPSDQFILPEKLQGMPSAARLTVEDDGPGIPADVMARMFEPYFTTKSETGTGLGLCIVQRLVRQGNGALHVHSEVNKGTVFHIYLPLMAV
ncbi:MAG: Response regulator receiver sensor signal transduction histidine kinase [Verrucomicrobiales bacterium]|nr:Response regulator receiver sensor signal transduction histidine kinase [Verrucomicrobiales bacterium]